MKPHIFKRNGYYRVTHTPKEKAREVGHLYVLANLFVSRLNMRAQAKRMKRP